MTTFSMFSSRASSLPVLDEIAGDEECVDAGKEASFLELLVISFTGNLLKFGLKSKTLFTFGLNLQFLVKDGGGGGGLMGLVINGRDGFIVG